MRIGLGVLLTILMGCTPGHYDTGMGGGAGAGGGGGASGPQSFFNQNVAPILMQNCAACHLANGSPTAPRFLGPSQTGMYAALKADRTLTGDPNRSLLLTKGAHEGPAWTSTQAATVHLWLQMENPGNPDPGTGGTGGGGGVGGSGGAPGGTGGAGGTGGTGGTTTNPSCDDLAFCCEQLPPDYQADCQNLVAGLDEQLCQRILDDLQQQGLCQ